MEEKISAYWAFCFEILSFKIYIQFIIFLYRTKFLIVEITSVTMEPFVLDDNGLIVEHWDNKEVMPKVEDLTNRGKF